MSPVGRDGRAFALAMCLASMATHTHTRALDGADPLRVWIQNFRFAVPATSIPFDIPFLGARRLNISGLVGSGAAQHIPMLSLPHLPRAAPDLFVWGVGCVGVCRLGVCWPGARTPTT